MVNDTLISLFMSLMSLLLGFIYELNYFKNRNILPWVFQRKMAEFVLYSISWWGNECNDR